jgi:restriction system protein
LEAREAEKRTREAEKRRREAEKAAAQQRVDTALAEVDQMNRDLNERVAVLEQLLSHTLERDDYLDFETLKDSDQIPDFDPGPLGLPGPPPQYREPAIELPPPLSAIARLVPGAKKKFEERIRVAEIAHAEEVERAKAGHAEAMRKYSEEERTREVRLAKARADHEAAAAELREQAQAQHRQVDEFRRRFEEMVPDAVCAYFDLVLQRSAYPQGFPRTCRLAYVPESHQLVVEFELPGFDVVPEVSLYKYVKAKNAVVETARPMTQRKQLYASVIAQTTIRTIHELFEADRWRVVETIVFNGMVSAVDRATGKDVRPCLVTVRTTRGTFEAIDARRVEPLACLKALSASVSKSPSELAPVRPVLEFDMVDPRFIDSADVIGGLDQRANLMELSPTEFEGLIANLFERMGLEMRQTRPSRDGGVDCVAYDPRPIFGGKVVIQAKRYKNTVGVAAVRDLFGTVHNEGASKGILVTTSGYGQSSFEFAQGKPLELLDGSNLLYLLAEHAGMEAKIEPPEDWVDPSPDLAEPGTPPPPPQ